MVAKKSKTPKRVRDRCYNCKKQTEHEVVKKNPHLIDLRCVECGAHSSVLTFA